MHEWGFLIKKIKKSGLNLNGDFSRGHDQVGALLRPAVDELSTQSKQGLREQRLAMGVHAWRTHHRLLMVHTEIKSWRSVITPTGSEWVKLILTTSLREITWICCRKPQMWRCPLTSSLQACYPSGAGCWRTCHTWRCLSESVSRGEIYKRNSWNHP